MTYSYYTPKGGLPHQSESVGEGAIATPFYVHIPAAVLTDIVTSSLPHWKGTRLWVLARPLSGFAETFSHYVMDVAPGGGSNKPDDDKTAEHALFVTAGEASLKAGGKSYRLAPGSFAYIPAGEQWSVKNTGKAQLGFHWFRKRYEKVKGIKPPKVMVANDGNIQPDPMPDCNGGGGAVWATTRFVDPDDLAHDMHVNIVTFRPGGAIPFPETHVMEHGIFILEGTARYLVNRDWIDVGPGDYLWLRAFCPQRCIATGAGLFRYLLYKDVNRHAGLR